MMMCPGPPGKHQIRAVLSGIFAEATAEGLSSIRAKAADLYIPAGSDITVAACCEVMVREMGRRDRIGRHGDRLSDRRHPLPKDGVMGA